MEGDAEVAAAMVNDWINLRLVFDRLGCWVPKILPKYGSKATLMRAKASSHSDCKDYDDPRY